ncbi:acidic fibroblast growth factor intracellular-binding protein B-like [Artemia franciscana]|uniref:Uncharacterized protein n=1 Tax=Artemia franciscana TaxID=6661 RepID=A0AA88KTE5_ARTSF|nr:hypothetical protein QYM36_019406 [Artemia franciscana]
MTELDVFVGSTIVMDKEIFQLWVDGHSVETTKHILFRRMKDFSPDYSKEVVLSYVLGQYRTYEMLEKLLWTPKKLVTQWAYQMTEQAKQCLIHKYYDLNLPVVREILNKKYSSRSRKDLDEISEKTNVNLKSCRRQFDNLRRMLKYVEELPGNT